MHRNKKLYYENKVKFYEKELETELTYIKGLQERIADQQITAQNRANFMPNSEFIELTKALNRNRTSLLKAENRVKTLRETIKRNHDLWQETN